MKYKYSGNEELYNKINFQVLRNGKSVLINLRFTIELYPFEFHIFWVNYNCVYCVFIWVRICIMKNEWQSDYGCHKLLIDPSGPK